MSTIAKYINGLAAIILLFPFVCVGQVASKIAVSDTRHIDDAPVSFNREVKFDFKLRNAVGVPGLGNYSGQMTIAPWADNSGNRHHQLNFNDGGIFYRTGRPDDSTWGIWQRMVIENGSGNVGIGTDNPQAKLAVNGNILAKEVKVKTDISVPDYVFEPDYELPSLAEIEAYVKQHKHLPEVPSAADIQRDGLDLAAMNLLLLKKVEELTLHAIRQQQEIKELKKDLASIKKP
ncbi:hypothetical protein SAMN05421747_13215 [Parapedobacter composti]|uniref:Chaperone of endosialidase n=1 Tax=Parapedobacter composti TaxID=623281 RepID=A0A1I1MCA7_9SPHI|nr:hypothetical protein [Parapedobacter composti]SFC82825.1 hypothetical protein SAMN05421747_13215 [Parapedobacter composti]